jgi:transposase
MKRFVEGEDRTQATLLPERLDDYVGEDNPVRAIDVFINELDLSGLGFEGMAPAATGHPAYHLRRQTVEHPFGTLKAWMGSTHFLTKRLPRVSTEMSLHVLAYNLKSVMRIVGIVPLMQAMRA